MLEGYESTLTGIERRIMDGSTENVTGRVNELRGDLLTLRSHYEQLIDLGQELEENENGFFREEQLRLFHMFTDRVSRLQDNVASLRDYAVQVRELHQAQLDVRQNRTMAVLTVITTLFLPLTVITGWFGMNFEHMGILRESWGYPLIIALSVTIVAVCLLYFKRKKML